EAMSAGIGKNADRTKFAAMVDVVTGRCVDDKWSRDAIECFAAAKSRDDVKSCNGKLSAEQNAAMNRAMREIVAGREQLVEDKMSDCKDKKCADDTHEEYIAWKKGNKDEKKPDKDQMERYEQIKVGMNACRSKVSGDTMGAPPPATAPAPAADGSAAK